MKNTILITDKNHEHFNKRLKGSLVYYDFHHTGNSPDLFNYITPDGKTKRILSDKIDVQDYENQLKAEQVKELGVNIGDKVMILKSGSGSMCAYFDSKQPHLVTNIFSSGNVEFDNGKSNQFRPKMELYNGELPIQFDFEKKSKVINNDLGVF